MQINLAFLEKAPKNYHEPLQSSKETFIFVIFFKKIKR